MDNHHTPVPSLRLNAKTASLRKQVLSPPSSGHTAEGEMAGVHEDTQFVLATTRDRHMEKEDLASYVSRKREMFLVQYSLGVKREEIRKLEEIAMVSWLSSAHWKWLPTLEMEAPSLAHGL